MLEFYLASVQKEITEVFFITFSERGGGGNGRGGGGERERERERE